MTFRKLWDSIRVGPKKTNVHLPKVNYIYCIKNLKYLAFEVLMSLLLRPFLPSFVRNNTRFFLCETTLAYFSFSSSRPEMIVYDYQAIAAIFGVLMFQIFFLKSCVVFN